MGRQALQAKKSKFTRSVNFTKKEGKEEKKRKKKKKEEREEGRKREREGVDLPILVDLYITLQCYYK